MRLIKNPKSLTVTDLENYDWDLIELPIRLDVDAAIDWFNKVKELHADCAYRPGEHDAVIGSDSTRKQVFDYLVSHALWGSPWQWMLQWSYDRYGILPSIANGNRVLYPELADPNFDVSTTNLSHYMFGAYQTYHDMLGDECFRTTKLLEFCSGDGLQPHVDVDVVREGKWKFRLSFQLNVDSDAWWRFSDVSSPHLSKADCVVETESNDYREYRLETGKVYLVNTAVTHSIKNEGSTSCIIIQSDPNDETINRLLNSEELHL